MDQDRHGREHNFSASCTQSALERKRIISARPAEKAEHDFYYQQNLKRVAMRNKIDQATAAALNADRDARPLTAADMLAM